MKQWPLFLEGEIEVTDAEKLGGPELSFLSHMHLSSFLVADVPGFSEFPASSNCPPWLLFRRIVTGSLFHPSAEGRSKQSLIPQSPIPSM